MNMNNLALKLAATVGICFSLALAYGNYELKEQLTRAERKVELLRDGIITYEEVVDVYQKSLHEFQQLHYAWFSWQQEVAPNLVKTGYWTPRMDSLTAEILNHVRILEEYSDRLVEMGFAKNIKK